MTRGAAALGCAAPGQHERRGRHETPEPVDTWTTRRLTDVELWWIAEMLDEDFDERQQA